MENFDWKETVLGAKNGNKIAVFIFSKQLFLHFSAYLLEWGDVRY